MQRRKTTCALEEGLLEAAELGERGRVPHGAGLYMAVGSENKCMHGQRLACMVLVRGTGAACLPPAVLHVWLWVRVRGGGCSAGRVTP